ncbi:DUF1653 domain-containing protein [Candidatus Chromulinivorax destructor]|nr:DUF1653 domain-containing protein [Candidatus Chromulinivorax destructor]
MKINKIFVTVFIFLMFSQPVLPMITACTPLKKLTQQSYAAMTVLRKKSCDMKAGDTYQHYKGGMYEIIAPVAHHSEDLSEMVVYKALYHAPGFGDNSVWVRPRAMFKESVVIDGKNVLRFKKVGSLSNNTPFVTNVVDAYAQAYGKTK